MPAGKCVSKCASHLEEPRDVRVPQRLHQPHLAHDGPLAHPIGRHDLRRRELARLFSVTDDLPSAYLTRLETYSPARKVCELFSVVILML